MTFKDMVVLYEKKKDKFGTEAYKHVSKVLDEAKELHRKDWLKNPTPQRDYEQSWKGFKGRNLERLIIYIIKDEVESLGLKIVSGNTLEQKKPENLSEELSKIKRAVSINYGEFGLHLPDADVIIYNPKNLKVIAILSSKSSMRERVSETGYWKIKLSQDPVTRNIRLLLVTPDLDGDLTYKFPTKKNRAIVEVDTDGGYVMSEAKIEETNKVKMFDKFIEDLRKFVKDREENKQ
ncbi:DNA modification methylase [Candidatus Desantisbacteria bacterium CG_4_10_14_0_8_um_filter_39_17]|uniref:DNA modification methylase n=1 Tax=Candidatus Desantisbacteria bacterium CG_4_10_14_0_8_um_filter_39_17 TaxID=1974542 RepID=A0A2H9PAC1_9BACT|nr:MAG: DNA modification methylase [Candidatus Desantisbacteria bacterium CG_4_10_14_0_8_um_filter_39_17]